MSQKEIKDLTCEVSDPFTHFFKNYKGIIKVEVDL